MTVANVKRMCQQLFKLDVARQRLFAKARSESDMWNAELMEEDLKPISFYITHEECDIVMQEADEAVAQRDAKDKQEKQKQLEEAQAKQQAALMAAQEEEVAAGKMAALAAVSAA
jgi:C4-dicarboxylate-specific signal transduction histidine kinase